MATVHQRFQDKLVQSKGALCSPAYLSDQRVGCNRDLLSLDALLLKFTVLANAPVLIEWLNESVRFR